MITSAVEVIRGRTIQISLPQRLINRSHPHHDIIVAYLGHNQQEYIALLPEIEATTFYCPKCGSLTHFHQWKSRSSWSSDSMIPEIPQLQVLCINPACKKTHVIIPDFLNPYKRYVGAEIEAAMDEKSRRDGNNITEAEESTLRRWIRQFSERLPEILRVLVRLLMIEHENMLSLLDCSQGLGRLRRILGLFPPGIYATSLGQANLELFYGGSRQYF